MIRFACAACASLVLALLVGLGIPSSADAQLAVPQSQALPPAVAPAVADVMQSGVLIVISKPSQQMYVFQDGAPWRSSAVSTGRRGHSTPAGVFPILQKKVRHHSNLYSNAPMPYMQRLTWRGIAIHAGHLPGYPASHGCIRVPLAFARALFALTRMNATTVVVTDAPLHSHVAAATLALDTSPRPAAVPLVSPAQSRVAVAPDDIQPTGSSQTIQLAAALSMAEADAHWNQLLDDHPELARFRKSIEPAIVGSRQYYRVRASAPDAHAFCASLKRTGEACFNVG